MSKPLRVLLVEDSEDDAELVLLALQRGGYDVTHERVFTAPAMSAALEQGSSDVIIADYSMPQFDGMAAFHLYQEMGLDLPFLIVSGTIGEEIAVAAMKVGVHDYIMKCNLTRLVPAIEREINEAKVRRARQLAEGALRESEARYRTLFEAAGDAIFLMKKDRFLECNERTLSLFQCTWQDIINKTPADFSPPFQPNGRPSDEKAAEKIRAALDGKTQLFEWKYQRLDGTPFDAEVTLTRVELGSDNYIQAIVRDITNRKLAEMQITRQLKNLAAMHAIDKTIKTNTDLQVILGVLLRHITERLKVDAADILLYEQPTQTLILAHQRGFLSSNSPDTVLEIGTGFSGQAFLERSTVYLPDLSKISDPHLNLPSIWKDEGFVTYFGVPLIAKGAVNGILELFNRSTFEPGQEWLDFLDALTDQTALAIDNATMFTDLQRSNVELKLAYDTTLQGWAKALEIRDKETEGHSRRVTELTLRLARAMDMSKDELVHVRRGALLHDIGKMGIPDSILHKPGELNEQEKEVMRQHPIYAFELLSPISFLRPALDIPYYHHEEWGGRGYPRGLSGKQIPLAARIFAVVDVWDALNTDRIYRDAWPRGKVIDFLRDQVGIRFDPHVVDVFLKLIEA